MFQKLLENSKKSTAYIVDQITHICRDLKPRSPGSEGEREAAQYMAELLERECGCEKAEVEPYKVHPASFYWYCRITGILGILACLGFFVHPISSLVPAVLSGLLFLFFFVLYKPVLDPFFPELEGANVTAIRPCRKEVKRRLFINGHIDAAWEFPLNYYFGGIVFEIPNAMSLTGIIVHAIVAVCALCGLGDWTRTVAWCGLIFLPAYVAVGFTYNPKRVVDGANDNLTGCYMGITFLREMEQQGFDLEHTEIGVILTGSEEAGLRGAKAWCRAHKDDYKDVPTYIVGFDTIHDPKYLMVNERDLNDTQDADPALARVFYEACQDVGVPCRKGRVPLFGGSTDAAAFLQNGFRAVTITGLRHNLEDYYHTRRDTYDNLNEEGIENCYRAMVRMAELIDQGAVDQK